jgi:hypothetical protein
MSPKLLLPVMLLLLAINGCSKDGSSPTDPTGSNGGPTASGPADGDPGNNGAWPNPDGTTPSPEPVDTTTYTPAGSGGSTGSGGLSTSLMFQTSGSGRYNLGTCSAGGTWTDPLGHVYGPHNPNCLAYYSDGRAGANNKGQCVTSPEGYAGLWLNPQAHPTSPYHPKCLQLGTSTLSLALSFPVQAELYLANDGSGGSLLNFTSEGTVKAQLVYHGTADGTTTGAGVLVGTDNMVPARTWSIGFGQPALNYGGGVTNGDLISALQSSGVEVVACSAAVGCSLVTLKLSGL